MAHEALHTCHEDKRSLPLRLRASCIRNGERTALRWKEDGVWRGLTYGDLLGRVIDTARGLIASGVKPGDRVAVFADNGPWWVIADLAALSAGAVTVPIYPTSASETARYILHHCGAGVVFVDPRTADQVAHLPVETVLLSATPTRAAAITLNVLCDRGREVPSEEVVKRSSSLRETDLATVIYTSGTTGDPKGVMLTHGNILSNYEACMSVFDLGSDARSLSYLPLSHGFERMAGMFLMLFEGVTIAYSQSMATIPQDLLDIRPTVMTTVPRLLEKLHARVEENLSGRPRILRWLFKTGLRHSARCIAVGRPRRGFFVLLADVLFFRRVRGRMGGRMRMLVSGGAPLSREIAEFFPAIGVPVLQGYGLTESSPVITANRLGMNKAGTVGPALPGVEVRIAPDGEILARGPNIMKGYYRNPQATAESVDADGWLHTGDVGEIDADGFLRITDRKKELLVTSSGKKVAPQLIESQLILDPLVAQACVVGENRSYLCALLVPDFAVLERRAASRGLAFGDREELLRNERVQRWYLRVVERYNKDRAPFESIKKFRILPREWSIEAGEVTPTLKLRRNVIVNNFSSVIDGLYAEPATAAAKT